MEGSDMPEETTSTAGATGPAAAARTAAATTAAVGEAPVLLTMGYCVDCGDYVLGRPVRPINDRAEAVDQHRDCPRPIPPNRRPPTGPRPVSRPPGRRARKRAEPATASDRRATGHCTQGSTPQDREPVQDGNSQRRSRRVTAGNAR